MPLRFITVLLCLAIAGTAHANDDELVKILERRIVDSQQTLSEVRAFCQQRVAPLTDVESREAWDAYATELRQRVLDEVVFRGEAQRWKRADRNVEWLGEIEGGEGYRIRKLRYEALPGLWIPALLYEPLKLDGKVPVILNVNGHDGNGKAAIYKQIRCINLAKRGMLAMNLEWLGMGQLSGENYLHYRMNQLDLCGTSGLAPFFLAMQRGLDILLEHPHADRDRVAVAGLSGGGWQTIILSSLDTRVTFANPVAGYSSFLTRFEHTSDLGDSEQCPVDLARIADYTHLTRLMAPRGLLLTYNIKDDCCFASDHALPPLLDAARPVYEIHGAADRLLSHVNHDPGTHNFEKDNRLALYRALHAQFFDLGSEFSSDELDCEAEVKTAEQLHVELPEQNANFHSLAMDLLPQLPRSGRVPEDAEQFGQWAAEQREAVRDVLRLSDIQPAEVVRSDEQAWGDATVRYWTLRVAGTWTVPVVEIEPPAPAETVLVIADSGRRAAAETISKHLAANRRVLALDVFYHGEGQIAQRDFLFALQVSTVGHRPLGIQVEQVLAVARWASETQGGSPPTLDATGPRTSLAGLLATALDPDAIAGATLRRSLGSLKEIVQQNLSVNSAPEYFCFGLLETTDIPQLTALCAPRNVVMSDN